MTSHTLNLTDEQAEVIRQMLEIGGYNNASHVVDDALRLLKARRDEEQSDAAWLRPEIQLGLDSFDHGGFIELDGEDAIENLSAEIRRRGRERLAGDNNAAAASPQQSSTG